MEVTANNYYKLIIIPCTSWGMKCKWKLMHYWIPCYSEFRNCFESQFPLFHCRYGVTEVNSCTGKHFLSLDTGGDQESNVSFPGSLHKAWGYDYPVKPSPWLHKTSFVSLSRLEQWKRHTFPWNTPMKTRAWAIWMRWRRLCGFRKTLSTGLPKFSQHHLSFPVDLSSGILDCCSLSSRQIHMFQFFNISPDCFDMTTAVETFSPLEGVFSSKKQLLLMLLSSWEIVNDL